MNLEIVGKIVRKYSFEEPFFIPSLGFDLFTLPTYPYAVFRRNGYRIDTDSKRYDLITPSWCNIPEGENVRIRITGKVLKKISLLYKDREFPVLSLREIKH